MPNFGEAAELGAYFIDISQDEEADFMEEEEAAPPEEYVKLQKRAKLEFQKLCMQFLMSQKLSD